MLHARNHMSDCDCMQITAGRLVNQAEMWHASMTHSQCLSAEVRSRLPLHRKAHQLVLMC